MTPPPSPKALTMPPKNAQNSILFKLAPEYIISSVMVSPKLDFSFYSFLARFTAQAVKQAENIK